MFDTIFGLPVHALVIHAVVVLVPLCTVMVVVMAVSSTWRERLMIPTVVLLTVALGSTYVAKESGEHLQARLAGVRNADLNHHIDLGLKAIWVVGAFWLLGVIWFVLDRRARRAGTGAAPPAGAATATEPGRGSGGALVTVFMALTVVAAIFATTWIVLTGDAGSRAVWRQTIESTNNR